MSGSKGGGTNAFVLSWYHFTKVWPEGLETEMTHANDPLVDCVRAVLTNISVLRHELNKLEGRTSFTSAELENIKHLAYEVWIPLLNGEGVVSDLLWTVRELAANFKTKNGRHSGSEGDSYSFQRPDFSTRHRGLRDEAR